MLNGPQDVSFFSSFWTADQIDLSTLPLNEITDLTISLRTRSIRSRHFLYFQPSHNHNFPEGPLFFIAFTSTSTTIQTC